MDKLTECFEWPVRVYYEDTDAGGVVYHSQYLNYCERARTEWLRALGVVQTALLQDKGLIFVVHSLQAEYQKPAKFDDALIVESSLVAMSAASLSFKQVVLRENQPIFKASVKVACVDANKQRPAKIPNSLSAVIKPVMSTQ